MRSPVAHLPVLIAADQLYRRSNSQLQLRDAVRCVYDTLPGRTSLTEACLDSTIAGQLNATIADSAVGAGPLTTDATDATKLEPPPPALSTNGPDAPPPPTTTRIATTVTPAAERRPID